MVDHTKLILASGSPQRRQLLSDAGYEFDVVAPGDHVECGVCSQGGPATLVAELAVAKALEAARMLQERCDGAACRFVILACDTLAECGGEVLGKPVDEAHARSMLERLRGMRHRVHSGVCVWRPLDDGDPASPDVRLATSELQMESLTDEAIDDYLATGLWQGKAGAFGIQDRPTWLRLVAGSESNVIGLPMELTREMLAECGIQPLQNG